MKHVKWISLGLMGGLAVTMPHASAAKSKAPEVALSQDGERLEAKFSTMLSTLQGDIKAALPVLSESSKTARLHAREVTGTARTAAEAAQQELDKTRTAKALVDHAKGKWIGGAEKGIAAAEAALKKATTDDARKAAADDLAKWQANREAGIQALKERLAALDKAKLDEPGLIARNQAAQAALGQALAAEAAASKAVLAELDTFLSDHRLDAKITKCTVLTEATPRRLAAFAQQNPTNASLVAQLLADESLMHEMLVAGGARFGNYGEAMRIFTAIQRTSRKAREGELRRLALATAIELCDPIKQANAADQTGAPEFVDPVKRYLHYEKAYLSGELDPAFKDFSAWEYRMVVDCDAPDEILAWGRDMLRTYRPDQVSNPDYGWRYSAAVRTDVSYGSQNVKNDSPSLNTYQNIPRNGGVCGRRAFFGRFILRSFGIPVWGVTQHKHAALSHWTPNGWVVNLGAGFDHSWWDKDEAPRSGADFLLETQARNHGNVYLKVLRAQWVSRILGEQPFNDRTRVAGGLWSNAAHDQTVALAADSVKLGPLGQELAEANEPLEKRTATHAPSRPADLTAVSISGGIIHIPATAHGKSSGPAAAMASASGGTQMHCGGGFKTTYEFEAPTAGIYQLTARVATLQDGQSFLLTANNDEPSVNLAVPYTTGLWQQTKTFKVRLVQGRNTLHFQLREGSRGVTIRDFTLTPAN